MKFHWNVEIPESGPLTREQGWAALASVESKLDQAMRRLELTYGGSGTGALSTDEKEELQALSYRLKLAVSSVEKDVLDQLAAIAEPEKNYPDPLDRFPKDIRDLINGYHGDVYRWSYKGDNSRIELAFALLESEGFEPEEIGQIIKKHLRPGDNFSDAYECPQCDDGKVGSDLCKRCLGWGYVIGDQPALSEYDWSEKGRKTLNDGGTWTQEQEDAEEERVRLEESYCHVCKTPFDATSITCDC